MDPPQLPVELMLHIAIVGGDSTFRDLLALPIFARYTVSSVRGYILSQFTDIVRTSECIRYTICGRLHREDGPAIITTKGNQQMNKI